MSLRYPYLHGFGTGRRSTKGVHFRDLLAADGVRLDLLDLNVPSFETQTYSAILDDLDGPEAETPENSKLCAVGSSMGGYLAARWAELRPERFAGLFLLCPGFDLTARWPLLLGDDAFRSWEADGSILVEHGDGPPRRLHWDFVLDSRKHPEYPEVSCPTRIVHGIHDDVVPIEVSRRYAADHDNVRLVELDDDHRLMNSLDRIAEELRAFIREVS